MIGFAGQLRSEVTAELENLLRNSATSDNIKLAITLALLHSHESQGQAEQYSEEIVHIHTAREKFERSASDEALGIAASFYFHVGDLSAVHRILETVIAVNNTWLLIWIKSAKAKYEGHEFLEISKQSLNRNGTDAGTILALAKLDRSNGDIESAMMLLDRLCLQASTFIPAYIEKVDALVGLKRWDEANACLDDVMKLDYTNSFVLQMKVFLQVILSETSSKIKQTSKDLVDSLKRKQDFVAACIYNKSSEILTKLWRNTELIDMARQLSDIACLKDPTEGRYKVQLAYCIFLSNDFSAAMNKYEESIESDSNNFQAILGVIHCLLSQGKIEDAQNQIELTDLVHQDSTIW